jgi:Flp pilus assembly pilin Flp
MRKLTKPVSGLTQDRGGVTALEYALIAAVMGALVVTAVTTLGGSLKHRLHEHRLADHHHGVRHVISSARAGDGQLRPGHALHPGTPVSAWPVLRQHVVPAIARAA